MKLGKVWKLYSDCLIPCLYIKASRFHCYILNTDGTFYNVIPNRKWTIIANIKRKKKR